jgi:hypothetical protein
MMMSAHTAPNPENASGALIAGMPMPVEFPRPGTIPIPPQPEVTIIPLDDEDEEEDERWSEDRPQKRPIYRRIPVLQ